MKPYTMLIASFFFISVVAIGQSSQQELQRNTQYFSAISSHSEQYLQKGAATYTRLLTSDNSGIVESAIAHLAYLKMGLPKVDLTEARKIIADLAESGKTPVVRYKAYLATVVFESPELFVNGLTTGSSENDQFFLEIASRVQQTLLGHNVN